MVYSVGALGKRLFVNKKNARLCRALVVVIVSLLLYFGTSEMGATIWTGSAPFNSNTVPGFLLQG